MARATAAAAPARTSGGRPVHAPAPGTGSRPAHAPARPPHAPPRPRPATAPRRPPGHAQPETRPAPPVDRRRRVALAVGRFVEARTQGLIDRLLRGRLWVGFVGALLAGIVFLNVSLLQINQEIARTSAHATALDRQNSELRARLAVFDSSERIQRIAEQRGMTMPAPDQYRYIEARPWLDGELAARRAVPPRSTAPAATTVAQSTVPPATTGAQPAPATTAASASAAAAGLSAAAPTATAGTP